MNTTQELQHRIANTLQARLSWRQAEACAADIQHHIDKAVRAAEFDGFTRGRLLRIEEERQAKAEALREFADTLDTKASDSSYRDPYEITETWLNAAKMARGIAAGIKAGL